MFKEELKLVPHKPGSYQMYNKDGIIIYVGKAKDLNKRLHSYFRGTVTGKTALMVSEIDHSPKRWTHTVTPSMRTRSSSSRAAFRSGRMSLPS